MSTNKDRERTVVARSRKNTVLESRTKLNAGIAKSSRWEFRRGDIEEVNNRMTIYVKLVQIPITTRRP